MGVTFVRSFGALAALREEWDALASRMASPVFDHDWFSACAEAFYAERDLRIVIAAEDGRVTGIAPLALESTPAGRRLSLLGASSLYEPSGWLFESTQVIEELIDPVIEIGHPVLLRRVSSASGLCAKLRCVARGRAIGQIRASAPSLAVDTRGSWESYVASLSTRITHNLPRIRRRAERTLGRMQFVRSETKPADVDHVLETFVAIEGSGWKGRRGSSLRARPDLAAFFRRYSQRAAARGRLRVSTLLFGSHIAAMELAVEAYGRLWQLKIGYDDALSEFYPGLHLTEASLRATFDRGLDAYEFLGSAEPWEERWRPETRQYDLLVLYPLNPAGFVGACCDLAGSVWRRATRTLRPAPAGGALERSA